jgi:hypothetical protein
LQSLFTTFVIAPAYLVWDRLRERFSGVRPRGEVLIDDEGLARFDLPSGWAPAGAVNVEASLQICDHRRRRFAIVFSEAREDFERGMTLDAHSSSTRSQLTASLRVLDVRGPQYREVGGFPAVQYEIEGALNLGIFRYLHTTIEGARAFHQVLCWTKKSRFDRLQFERLLDAFSEVPGPAPAYGSVPSSAMITVEPTSAYDVH